MTTWRDERRKDQAAAAQQALAAQMAIREQDRADAAATADRRRADRAEARKRRKAFWAGIIGWLGSHATDLLFLPVIVIPAVLAWPAMAAYGMKIFPLAGVLLPGFTEGAMWAFAFAVTIARREGKPVWSLQLGLWLSCVAGGGVNFLHGYTEPEGSLTTGVVMALVSVGGVLVHQLITARPPGPRPSRQERDAARLTRLAQRRATAVRAVAVRRAVADVDPDGGARLVFQSGLVRLTRSWSGRSRLVPAIVPRLTPRPLPSVDPATADLVDEITAYLATASATTGGNPAGTGTTPSPETRLVLPPDVPERVARRVPDLLARVREGIRVGELPARPRRTEVQKFLKVRAQVAIVVTHALYGEGDGNSPVGAVS